MSWNILTYAFGTEKYLTCQKFLTEHAAQFGVNHIAFTEEDLHLKSSKILAANSMFTSNVVLRPNPLKIYADQI